MMVTHPRMISPSHPLVRRVRKLCLAYPEAVEVESWGRPAFRAGKRTFVLVSTGVSESSIVIKPEPHERPAYLGRPGFFSPPYWGASGWLGVETDGPVGWDEIAELIEISYRQVALKRQITALDSAVAE